MKPRDLVRIVGQTLVTQFEVTGERGPLVSINLAPGATFRLSPVGAPNPHAYELQADLHARGSMLVLEVFASEALAQRAFARLQAVLAQHMRLRNAANVLCGFVKYILIPAGVLLIGLAMNVAVHPEFGRTRQPQQVEVPAPPPPAIQSTAAPTGPSATQIATALSQGAASKKYSVQLGTGKKGTLYVFEDPLCPHCQDFAPELATLARDHSVFVFPVSVIGGAASAAQAAVVLCEADPSKRRAAWSKAQAEGLPTKGSIDPKCTHAVNANDDIFQVLGLKGTPTVISGSGRVMPYDVPASASAISAWLNEAG